LGKLHRVGCAGVFVLACASAVAQPQLTCASDSLGRSWCVDTGALRQDGNGNRVTSLYQGNSRVAHPVGYVARANCQDQVLEFLSAGRAFWVAFFDASPIAVKLGAAMCS
jgi:hypothetical protein